jgi:hypothetical protein
MIAYLIPNPSPKNRRREHPFSGIPNDRRELLRVKDKKIEIVSSAGGVDTFTWTGCVSHDKYFYYKN